MTFKRSAGETKILVIEDDTELAEIVGTFLSTAGYKVVVESQAQVGIKRAKTFNPHLILLDFSMPGMDGYDVCAELKGDARTANIPVVFLAGKDTHVDDSRSFQSGISLWVKKPFSCERLLDIIRIVLLAVGK